jgi:hypothetical protein
VVEVEVLVETVLPMLRPEPCRDSVTTPFQPDYPAFESLATVEAPAVAVAVSWVA